MSFRVCFLETLCTSEEIAHAQGRQNSQAFIELTRVSFEGLFFSSFFLPLPLPSAIDKIHFNIAERKAVTDKELLVFELYQTYYCKPNNTCHFTLLSWLCGWELVGPG